MIILKKGKIKKLCNVADKPVAKTETQHTKNKTK